MQKHHYQQPKDTMMATRTTTTSKPVIELAGKLAGTVSSLQLPGYRVDKVMVPAGPNRPAHGVAQVSITPLDAAFNLTQSNALTDWVLSLPRGGQAQPLDGAALVLDFNNKLTRRVEWTEALVTELRLPELDAASKVAFSVGVSWLPSTVSFAKASGEVIALPPISKTKALLLSNFRVQGLPFDGKFVSRISLPTVTATVAAPKPEYAQMNLGEVRLVLSAISRDSALAWVQQVVADGQIADKEALSFSVELLDAAFKNVRLTVQLGGCALLGYEESRLDAAQEASATVTVRFSVGKLDMVFSPN